ncbi:hypothetical protein YC2023_115930 [Brassica napus]
MSSEDNHTTATSGETSENCVDSADGSKRTCDSSELERMENTPPTPHLETAGSKIQTFAYSIVFTKRS